jgi:hypothetical protein
MLSSRSIFHPPHRLSSFQHKKNPKDDPSIRISTIFPSAYMHNKRPLENPFKSRIAKSYLNTSYKKNQKPNLELCPHLKKKDNPQTKLTMFHAPWLQHYINPISAN